MESVLRITDEAYDKVLYVRARERDAERYALWVEITGLQGGDFVYDFAFGFADEARAGDHVELHRELDVVVSAASVEALRGAILDRHGDLETRGLAVHNPNSPRNLLPTQPPAALPAAAAPP